MWETIEAADLTDFNEAVDDRAAALIQNGTGITWSYNDGAGTLTPTVTITQYTDEMAQDAAASLIQNGTGISWSYNDAGNTLTPTVTLAPFSTTNLAEGANLYFTDERVDDRVAALIQNGTGITWSYNDAGGTLTPTVSLAAFSTTNLAEGANLYFTDERAQDAVGTILIDTATINFTYNDGTPSIVADLITNPLVLSGGQIQFPATQSPSADANTLDDYEEGTWTPTITFATPGNLSVAYTTQSGSYTKIGRMVFGSCSVAHELLHPHHRIGAFQDFRASVCDGGVCARRRRGRHARIYQGELHAAHIGDEPGQHFLSCRRKRKRAGCNRVDGGGRTHRRHRPADFQLRLPRMIDLRPLDLPVRAGRRAVPPAGRALRPASPSERHGRRRSRSRLPTARMRKSLLRMG